MRHSGDTPHPAQEDPDLSRLPAAGSQAGSKNGFGSGGHVVCAIISPLATAGTYGQTYYHYSLLRTLEDGFGLAPYLGNANAITPIASIWRPPAG